MAKKFVSESIMYNVGGNLCFLASPTLDSTNYPSTWPNISSLWCLVFQQISCLEALKESIKFPWNNCVYWRFECLYLSKKLCKISEVIRSSIVQCKLFVQPALLQWASMYLLHCKSTLIMMNGYVHCREAGKSPVQTEIRQVGVALEAAARRRLK